MKSGFVAFVGRPNVGKSTLLNQILAQKVSIVSDKVQTTRTRVHGVLTRGDVQMVFVDTPGILKPRTALGERTNRTATSSMGDVDVVCVVLDATMPLGRGDRWVSERAPKDSFVVVNKCDVASQSEILEQLRKAGTLDFSAFFPVSAVSGAGVDALLAALSARMPEGPPYYPADVVTDTPEEHWIAELVREQLLSRVEEEVPHSIACRVVDMEDTYVRVEILVERESQKGIVIGRGGAVLKAVGIAVREQLPEGVFVELFVKVDKDWQRRPRALDRLGY